MSFNLANMSFEERAQIEAEKARLFELWQNNLGKAKGEAENEAKPIDVKGLLP